MASGPAEPHRWVRIIDAATRRYAAAAAQYDHAVGAKAGLTLSTCEARFVGLLYLHGPLSPSRLGRLAGLTSSGTITGIIDRLESAGYVQRTRCVEDRRKVSVSLNLDWLDKENAPRAQRLAGLIADYDEERLAVIADFLTRLADAEAGPESQDPACGSER